MLFSSVTKASTLLRTATSIFLAQPSISGARAYLRDACESDGCRVHAVCVPLSEAYECECKKGYNGDGVNVPGMCATFDETNSDAGDAKTTTKVDVTDTDSEL